VIGIVRRTDIIRKILPKENVMKHNRIILAIAVLVLATLACQAVMGGGARDLPAESEPATEATGTVTTPTLNPVPQKMPTERPAEDAISSDSTPTGSSQFPMTADAYNVVEVGDGSLIYYTKLSAEEAMQFYRDEYTSRGYTEREDLTIVVDGMFSMVFDGDPSGKSVIIQSVDLGDGSRTIAIRLEDV
jgi:hypothetical protein